MLKIKVKFGRIIPKKIIDLYNKIKNQINNKINNRINNNKTMKA